MKITQCRNCKSEELKEVLNLGNQPPSNSFIKPENVNDLEKKYPLVIVYCSKCSLIQLNFTVDPHEIFGEYVYVTSNTKPLAMHLKEMAKSLYDFSGLKTKELVIDIGCNDGTLLSGYPAGKVRLLGLEPSSVAEFALNNGIPVRNAFFNSQTAKDIVRDEGKAKIITATNVFAHVPDQDDFMKGIDIVLDEDGMFVIEVPHILDMLQDCLFDTIYHEHIFYFSLIALENLLDKRGFRIFNVEKFDSGPSGPPIRVFICKKGAKYESSTTVQKIKEEEIAYGLNNVDIYHQFSNKVWEAKSQLLKMLEKLHNKGERIVGFGAPAKGNTILNTFGLDRAWIDFILEKNELKCNLVTPGTHVPIVNEDSFDTGPYKYALLLSWNIVDFLIKKSDFIKNGGKFIVPLPEPKILP